MQPRLYWIEFPPHRIAIAPRPLGDDWLVDEVKSLRDADVDVLVSLLTQAEVAELGLTEEAIACADAGITFYTLPIADRGVPGDLRAFRGLITRLAGEVQSGRSIAIHCRAGIGRSGMVAACLLRMLGLESNDAFRRITAARGCGVPDTDHQQVWVTQFLTGM